MLAGVVKLALGTFQTLLVKKDGSAWSSGVNADGHSTSLSFTQIVPKGAIAAAAGNYFNVILAQHGYLLVTGTTTKKGHFFFLDLSQGSRQTFSDVHNIGGARTVTAGGYHSMVLTKEGVVWGIGWNKYGQLGDGTADDKTKFSVICSGAKDVAAGDIHSLIVKQDGSVWGAGRNYNGQLGDGSKNDSDNFVKAMVSGAGSGAAYVAAGGYHSMVLKDDGSVWATGCNDYGQLGDRSTTDRTMYVPVVLRGTKAIAAGGRHSMVLKQDGSVWATGWNEYGQLGDGSTTDRSNYVQVISSGVKTIAAGSRHSMMLSNNGSVWATGHNEYGQLGAGWKTNTMAFVQVISKEAKAVAAGAFHSMVLKQDGSVWGTGANENGQLGDGSILTLATFTRLAPFGDGS